MGSRVTVRLFPCSCPIWEQGRLVSRRWKPIAPYGSTDVWTIGSAWLTSIPVLIVGATWCVRGAISKAATLVRPFAWEWSRGTLRDTVPPLEWAVSCEVARATAAVASVSFRCETDAFLCIDLRDYVLRLRWLIERHTFDFFDNLIYQTSLHPLEITTCDHEIFLGDGCKHRRGRGQIWIYRA